MADFVLNAPGTVNNPFSPANIIQPIGTMQSDATGFFFGSGASGYDVFAHNTTYGSVITTTITASAVSHFDQVAIGAVVRSGANAGALICMVIDTDNTSLLSIDKTGSGTIIGSSVAFTWNPGDIMSCTITIVGGTATITTSQNGTPFTYDGNTTTAFTGEASLAAGGLFSPENVNGTKLSQFTGTGVSGGGGGGSTQVPYKPPPIYMFS